MKKVNVTDDEFVKELYLLVRKYCWKKRCYSEDLVQELMTYIVDKIDKFDSEKAEFSTWAYKLCHNKRLMLIRENQATKRKSNLYNVSLNAIIDDDDTEMMDMLADNYDENADYKREVVKCVYPHLSDIAKKYFDGVNQVDIAKEYNLSQAQISRIIKKEIAGFKKKFRLE